MVEEASTFCKPTPSTAWGTRGKASSLVGHHSSGSSLESRPLLSKASNSHHVGDPSNFWKEVLEFEVVDFASPYHAMLGRPCYAKFMAIPHYGCLKVKMPEPRVVIVVTSSRPKLTSANKRACPSPQPTSPQPISPRSGAR